MQKQCNLNRAAEASWGLVLDSKNGFSIKIWFSKKWFLNQNMVFQKKKWFLNQKMVSQNMVSQSKYGFSKYGFSIKKWFPNIWFSQSKNGKLYISKSATYSSKCT